jgi:hypothetical protein
MYLFSRMRPLDATIQQTVYASAMRSSRICIAARRAAPLRSRVRPHASRAAAVSAAAAQCGRAARQASAAGGRERGTRAPVPRERAQPRAARTGAPAARAAPRRRPPAGVCTRPRPQRAARACAHLSKGRRLSCLAARGRHAAPRPPARRRAAAPCPPRRGRAGGTSAAKAAARNDARQRHDGGAKSPPPGVRSGRSRVTPPARGRLIIRIPRSCVAACVCCAAPTRAPLDHTHAYPDTR